MFDNCRINKPDNYLTLLSFCATIVIDIFLYKQDYFGVCRQEIFIGIADIMLFEREVIHNEKLS